jgi:hypothetical protein
MTGAAREGYDARMLAPLDEGELRPARMRASKPR